MIKSVNLEDAYYQSLVEVLTTGKTALNMPINTFVKKNIDTLLKKASDPHSANVAVRTLTDLVKETQDYIDSKEIQDADYTEYLISRKLIPWQKDYFVDNARRIAVQAGRRSGKTYANALKAIKHCLAGQDLINGVYKFRKVVIVGLTKEKCQEQYWQLIKDTIDECHINTSKIDNGSLQILFSNGSSIKLSGNNSKAEREKLRGDEYSLIIIDECQSEQGLRYLMESIFEPIAYGRDSQIILSGTGALILGSYWQEITDGQQAAKWRHYHTTMKDNPTIANAEDILNQVLEDKNWTETEPEFVREYLGQNCYDTTRTVIPFRKYYDELPKDSVFERAVIGLDYGYADSAAFVPVLISNDGRRFVANVQKSTKLSASELVTIANEINEWCKSLKIPNIIFIADTNEQSISKDIWRCGIKIQNAYKVDERWQWSKLRENLQNGTLLIRENDIIDKECSQTVWKYDEDNKQIVYEIDDNVFHPDALDALRYANDYIDKKRNMK